MGTSKKRGKRSKEEVERRYDNQNSNENEEEQLPVPWKISILLTFLAILVISLFQSENHADILEATQKAQQNSDLEIPDPETPAPASMSKVYIFKHAAISSDSQICSDIARNLMRENNGNIFDAIIISLVCNSMANVQSMGLYGGFLLSAYSHEKKRAFIIDAQLTVPENFPAAPINLSDVRQGPLSIAVFSGFLKGLWEIHKNYASIPWPDLIKPSVELCKNGVILTKHLRDSIEYNQGILNDPYMKKLFVENDKIKKVGSKIVNFKHCDFLEVLLSHNDEQEIISGKVLEIIERDLKEVGSIITVEDLKSYKLKIYERELINLNDDYAMIIPDTAAILIPSILKILVNYNFNVTWFDDDDDLSATLHHRITEVFKHVFAMRSQLGDGDFDDIKKYLLSNEFADHVLKSIDDEAVLEDYGVDFFAPPDHGTSHISIVTEEGDAVAVTSSINFYFGAGLSGNSSGVIFNNGMDDFSYSERSVNYFGLKETPTNYPEKGKRALSSMSPIILIDRKTQMPSLIVGAAGGSKIISALSLAILRFLCCTQDIKEIIDAPRFHHQMIPNIFEYEYGVLGSVIKSLKEKGHDTKRYRNRGTVINALVKNKDSIHAISDYRKDSSGVAGY